MDDACSSLLGQIPDNWGPKFHAGNGAVASTQTGPNSIHLEAPCHMILMMHSSQPGRLVALNSDRKAEFMAPVGTMEIIPAGSDLFAQWKVRKENLLLALSPTKLKRLAMLELDDAAFEFRTPNTGHTDQPGLLLSKLINEEMQRKRAVNRDYLESLITVFSIHLLRNHAVKKGSPGRYRGGLPPKTLRDIEDYIRSNLDHRLTVEHLSTLAGISPSHFLRAFKASTGLSPHQYILSVRLENVERLVTTTDLPLSTIASLTGFSNHSHMTATMRRYRSTTPSALRFPR